MSALDGVDSVQVTLSAMAPKRQSAPAQNGLKDVAMIIAVSSCKGGVGKSTVAAHLARAMQQEGLAVGLLDVDIHGPSLPTLFKVNAPEVYMEGDLILPVEIAGLKTMSIGYLIGDKPAVMRGPMASNYAVQLLQQTQWGKLDYLIIDLPPGTGDIQLSLTQQTTLDGAIIVTTPQALSLVDVARGILMFEKVSVPVLGVVENMSCFSCDECGKVHYPFGKSAMTLKERFGLDTLAELPIVPGLSESVHTDEKLETEAFTLLATNVHREVGMRRITDEDRPVVTAGPGFVQIQWPDGRQDLIPNKKLRVSCQCALCVDEFTSEPLLNPAEVPENIEVEEIQPLGITQSLLHGAMDTVLVFSPGSICIRWRRKVAVAVRVVITANVRKCYFVSLFFYTHRIDEDAVRVFCGFFFLFTEKERSKEKRIYTLVHVVCLQQGQ